jgi:ABC-type branched-subunit amino acid transport system ATPase component
MNDFLCLKNLSKHFGGVRAVNDVSLNLKQGDVLGIIGPNGSGKTTLINMITGFIKPSSGKILFKGKDITGKMPYKIANLGIGRTFQMVKPFYHLPAYKNLIVPLYSPRVKRTEGKYGDRDAVAIDLLEDVGFERDSFVPYKLTGNLPHGYLKRLELARCMALRSELMIFDELFSGLSLAEVATIVPLIEHIIDEGVTVIMIEHRLRELFRIVNKVFVLDFGEKIAEGKPEEVMEMERVREAYLGVEVE